ncbi:hypothetical protein DSCW_01320 [Desulfosarcina widdelii]|uniref:Uncharacterized protein n=1 Tax=Desulfosarcina widdelii TaxID=947919 RepID=A0A5K7YWD7_9BACT|nr:hypothetical protein [Desulfosarcina widdelii]BBO72715.1 hypothetical protein DSCW_01320 [Desulfosarcina widdelii]
MSIDNIHLNNYIKKISFIFLIVLPVLILTGCGSNNIPLEERIRNDYVKNHRLDRYYELHERYDGVKVVLWLNSEEDRSWFLNFPVWAFFSIMPDLPEVLAGGGVIGIIYFVAWWIGVTLTGGGILAVLAWLGAMAGGIPGIPPAMVGIVFLCSMFVILVNIFGMVF